ncbi:hypothetical protein HO133_001928 [Letharia lupina]|uniref:Uncharacterized protein n=1 Tax=Letharia lupina TaxID=560253 RepID=A0A8H6FB70_9LECA|nr:uncharacterized protein HO133_001928 [Letharia lupina]KAF6221960.1 hypothetical protein HO133_001928 [Letharia lupina]
MKTSFFSCLALASSFAFAAPAVDSALVDRATVSPYYAPSLAILTSLYSEVRQYTAVMNATSATLKPHTAGQDTAAVNATYKSNIASINTAITGATADIKKLLASPAPAKRELTLVSRQATVSLPGELAMIIEEIGGTLTEIVATLGLTTTLSFLGPLVTSLGELVASLIPVVNNLLAVVEELLDGVLGGLSAALLGLTL